MNKPSHLLQYPCLSPFCGDHYRSERHKRLLVLGESHYLPKESDFKNDPTTFYNGKESDLDCGYNEHGWCNTDLIIRDAIKKGLPRRGIYREISWMIELALYSEPREWSQTVNNLNEIAFANYFVRPARQTGKSIDVHANDVRVANEVLAWNLHHLEPELVIFVSPKAWDAAKDIVQVPLTWTPHPSRVGWHQAHDKEGGLKGHELFLKFLQDQRWINPS